MNWHRFDADPDPNIHVDADPDPGPARISIKRKPILTEIFFLVVTALQVAMFYLSHLSARMPAPGQSPYL